MAPVAVMLDFMCLAESIHKTGGSQFEPKAVQFTDHLWALKLAARGVSSQACDRMGVVLCRVRAGMRPVRCLRT